LFYQ